MTDLMNSRYSESIVAQMTGDSIRLRYRYP